MFYIVAAYDDERWRAKCTADQSYSYSASLSRPDEASVDGGKEGRKTSVERNERRSNGAPDRPTDRPTKPALTFSRTCTYRSFFKEDSDAAADKGNCCSSNEDEGRLRAD